VSFSFENIDLAPDQRHRPGIEDVPILVHLGPHKTGSTWLQNLFFPALDNIIFTGNTKLTHDAFLTPHYGAFSIDAVAIAFAPLLEKARATGQPLIISDEALGGRAFGQKYVREVIAHRIKRAFPKAKILAASRRQDRILASLYSEYLRYGHNSTLSAFLDQRDDNPHYDPILDMRYYEWDRTLRFYQDVFGSDSVKMLPMERIISDGTFLTDTLGKFLDVSLRPPDPELLQRRERPSLSGWAMTALRLWNHLVPNDSRHRSSLRRFSPNSIAWQVDRLTPKTARKRTADAHNALIRAQLGDRFVLSNQSYAKLIEADLNSLGYHLGAADDPSGSDT